MVSLADLDCRSASLELWRPLQEAAVEALELWRADQLQEPPSELLDLCLDLMEIHKVKHQDLYASFWADRADADPWPFRKFCILGAVTALYLLAWGASSKGDLPQTEYFLMAGISMLRMDDHDFFEHSAWPFTSFDILSNVFFLRHGWPFQLAHLKPADSPWIRQRLPLVWPSHAPRCWPHCANEFQHELEHKLRKLKVWWTAKHPGPFVDLAFVLENWMSDRYDVQVFHHALGDICVYARYKDWLCSKDERLKEVMEEQRILNQITQSDCGEERGQWCGLRELHQEFDSKVLPRFQKLFPELRQMNMLACGHPLYWCRLLADFGVPLLGIWDMSHQLWVPEELQDQWTEDFLELFQRKENVLLTMSAHNSFQVRWLLGLKVPYFQPITPDVSLQARYAPELRPQEVFVSRFNTPYDVELLRRFAEEAAPLPFRFMSWEEMPCGKHCSKAQLAQFRASVLCAYDTGPLKLAEFYAMAIPIFIFSGGLWRTTMRWARADAKPAGPVAFSLGRDFRDTHPKNFQWLERALRNETESLHWEDPWHPQLTPDLYQGPPYVDLPYSPYFQDRAELITPGAAFWAQLTDWALLPHLLRYESVPQLLQMLLDLSLDKLREISRQMVSHYTKLLVASTNFWRAVVMSLVEDGDASKWKG